MKSEVYTCDVCGEKVSVPYLPVETSRSPRTTVAVSITILPDFSQAHSPAHLCPQHMEAALSAFMVEYRRRNGG